MEIALEIRVGGVRETTHQSIPNIRTLERKDPRHTKTEAAVFFHSCKGFRYGLFRPVKTKAQI